MTAVLALTEVINRVRDPNARRQLRALSNLENFTSLQSLVERLGQENNGLLIAVQKAIDSYDQRIEPQVGTTTLEKRDYNITMLVDGVRVNGVTLEATPKGLTPSQMARLFSKHKQGHTVTYIAQDLGTQFGIQIEHAIIEGYLQRAGVLGRYRE